MRRRMRLAEITALLLVASCGPGQEAHPERNRPNNTSIEQVEWFTDRAKDAGIDFVHVNGMSGQFYMTEIMAPGVALFDYDNDGDLDIYLVQGSRFKVQGSGSGFRVQGSESETDQDSRFKGRLYRNDLEV